MAIHVGKGRALFWVMVAVILSAIVAQLGYRALVRRDILAWNDVVQVDDQPQWGENAASFYRRVLPERFPRGIERSKVQSTLEDAGARLLGRSESSEVFYMRVFSSPARENDVYIYVDFNADRVERLVVDNS